ncbi:hypothetical protein LTR08_006130 [Meristemomyces frigidus]|nr:hypothetical protein LTR08_006130 [Meristemomyces frigidus]
MADQGPDTTVAASSAAAMPAPLSSDMASDMAQSAPDMVASTIDSTTTPADMASSAPASLTAVEQEYIDFLSLFSASLTSLSLDNTLLLGPGCWSTVLTWVHTVLKLDRLRLVKPGITSVITDRASSDYAACMMREGNCVDWEVEGIAAIREKLESLTLNPVYFQGKREVWAFEGQLPFFPSEVQ